MQTPTVRSKTDPATPAEWLCRRSRVSLSVAGAIAELAFATRVAHLGDRGDSLPSTWREGGR